ncbi:MAG: hypothetical protein FJ104_07015 [Deltaproteobacteria bacterium]|nr:hypothetical protein [Deltaproteobacteria bacterium]
MDVAPGEEVIGRCQSWTLGNPTPIFVRSITATNGGGFHHSNWIWVPDTAHPGPDGTWPCAERGFDQILAGAVGGVFFAQSTQARNETQAFPEGVAFEVPSNARIIGDVHLLNTADTPVRTRLSFDIETIPEAEVRVRLQPVAYTNLALDIAPAMKTSARMQCPTAQPDFDVYYVLPHYHTLATSLRLDVAGGPMNGTNLFTTTGAYGEALGQRFEPPFSVRGATGLVLTCDYENPRSTTVRYGFGDQEMCVALVYATGRKSGGQANLNLSTTDVGGVHQTDGLCLAASL